MSLASTDRLTKYICQETVQLFVYASFIPKTWTQADKKLSLVKGAIWICMKRTLH